MNGKRCLIAFCVLLGLLVLLLGCGMGRVEQIITTGTLKVEIEIPELNLPEQVVLSEISVTVSRGSSTYTKKVKFADDLIEVPFGDLDEGTWKVNVIVTDKDGFTVYEGDGSIIVGANQVVHTLIDLQLVPGSLSVEVLIPENKGITSGTVTLIQSEDKTQKTVKDLQINSTGKVSFSEIIPGDWLVKVQLFNAESKEVLHGEKSVKILPGRTLNASAELDLTNGSLEITFDLDILPSAPTGLMAKAYKSGIDLSWIDLQEPLLGYMVYRSTSEDGELQLVNLSVIKETTYFDTTVKSGRTYWYWVQSYSLKGYASSLSEPVMINF